MKRSNSWDPNFVKRSEAFEGLSIPSDYLAGSDFPAFLSMNEVAEKHGVVNFSGQQLKFVAQPPRGRKKKVVSALVSGYEERIFQMGEVQTRFPSWHDFFNHLVWLNFPKSKAVHNKKLFMQKSRTDDNALNAWKAGRRTREQDALALFDEGGVVLACDALIYDAVLSRLKTMRFDQCVGSESFSDIGSVYFRVFGHGIFEEFVHRSKETGMDIGALTIVVPIDLSQGQCPSNAIIDDKLAQIIAEEASLISPSEYSTVSVGKVFKWRD